MNAAVLIAHAGQARKLVPGIIASGVIATAAMFLSQHYGAPVMLFALLLGIAMNFLSSESVCAPGIGFTGRTVLRCGVALLGLRITLGDISALGWQPAAVVVGSVAVTILVSIGAARLLGFRWRLRLLSGGGPRRSAAPPPRSRSLQPCRPIRSVSSRPRSRDQQLRANSAAGGQRRRYAVELVSGCSDCSTWRKDAAPGAGHRRPEAGRLDGRRDYSAGSDRAACAAFLWLTLAFGGSARNAASREVAIRFCSVSITISISLLAMAR